MSTSIEQVLLGLVGLLTNARRPLPFAGTLGSYTPSLDDIKREPGSNIVMQYQVGNTVKPLDGGDSAHRTGVLAFCGSPIDAGNLDKFYDRDTRVMFRHPTQAPWNNPKNCSRDQLIGYLAGCWRTGRSEIAQGLFNAHKDRGFWCQNIENDEPGTTKNPPLGDPLGPHHIMYMRICAGDMDASTDLVSQLALYTAIQTASVDSEPNQILLMSIVGCQLDFLLAAQPQLANSLHNYWSGQPWRGQRSIATSLLDVVEIERGRYSTPNLLDYLVPQNILEELKHIRLEDALDAFRTGNPLYFAELAGKLVLAALRDIAHYVKVLLYSLSTLEGVALEFATGALTVLRDQASKVFKNIVSIVEQVGPLGGVLGPVLAAAGAILGLSSASENEEKEAEKLFRQEVLSQLQSLSEKSDNILKEIKALQASMEDHFAALTRALGAEFYALVESGVTSHATIVKEKLAALKGADEEKEGEEEEKDDIHSALLSETTALEVSILALARYGSPALPVCFHAYSIVVAGLAALKGKSQLEQAKKTFRIVFTDMLTGDKGLNKTIIGLGNEITEAYADFDRFRKGVLIGTVAIQQGFQRNMDTTKDILPNEGYQVTKVWCTVAGSIEAGNFSLTFATTDGGFAPLPYKPADGQDGVAVFSEAIFEVPPFNGGRDLDKFHSPDLNERQASALTAAVQRITSEGGSRVQGFLNKRTAQLSAAKTAKPSYETLAAAVEATFALDDTPVLFTPAPAPVPEAATVDAATS